MGASDVSYEIKIRQLEEEDKMESWIDWKQRVTREAVIAMDRAGIPDWVQEQRRRKWRWVGHVARRDDGRWTRWMALSLIDSHVDARR